MKANNARRQILAALRSARLPEPLPLPDIPDCGAIPGDSETLFEAALTAAGGEFLTACDRSEIAGRAEAFCPRADRVCSLIAEVPSRGVDLDRVQDPHALADLDLVVLPGRLAVAENGAVWVDGRDLPRRVLAFIPSHLLLVVARDRLVATLHQAYGRLDIQRPGYGLFISGPSKTADIEQALVFGAQGARRQAVLLVC